MPNLLTHLTQDVELVSQRRVHGEPNADGPGRQEDVVRWKFKVGESDQPEVWDWSSLGLPTIQHLKPVRDPVASARSRHTALLAYSTVTKTEHLLESGLEHDLFRSVDRLQNTAWIVAQPAIIEVSGQQRPAKHIPDLLTLDKNGLVTVWDARPPEKQDAQFRSAALLTGDACRAVGIAYRVFGGLSTVHRLNLLWLHSSRRRPRWQDTYEPLLLAQVADGPKPFSHLIAAHPRKGQITATLWHLLWRGDLQLDLTRQVLPDSPIWARRTAAAEATQLQAQLNTEPAFPVDGPGAKRGLPADG